jgi:hypothetical protein
MESKRPIDKWMRNEPDKDNDEKILNDWKEWEESKKNVVNRAAQRSEQK